MYFKREDRPLFIKQRPSKAKKIFNAFIILIIWDSIPCFYWSSFEVGSRAFYFWKNGIEKEGVVLRLIEIYSAPKAGKSYYYALKVDNKILKKQLNQKLPVGQKISILVSPKDKTDIVIGKRDDNLFVILSNILGGKIFGFFSILFSITLFLGTPALIRELIHNHNKMLNS